MIGMRSTSAGVVDIHFSSTQPGPLTPHATHFTSRFGIDAGCSATRFTPYASEEDSWSMRVIVVIPFSCSEGSPPGFDTLQAAFFADT